MSTRSPDEILGELGGTLERAWRDDRRPARALPRLRLRVPRRSAAAIAVALLVLVPTAVATREALWAPDPPPLPPALRAEGAAGTPVYVGAGEQRGVAWRLSATTCRTGSTSTVGLFLTVRGGGAGARCDVAPTPAAPRPAAGRVQSYYDPAADATWAFGTLPADARAVVVRSRAYGGGPVRTDRAAALAVAPRAIEQGHLPAGLRVFVLAVPGGREIAGVSVTPDDAARRTP